MSTNTFFDAPAPTSRSSEIVATKTLDERWEMNAAARFDSAPDADDEEIEVAPMDSAESPTYDEGSGPTTTVASVGHMLLKGMASNAKKVNPEGLRAVVTSVAHVPTTVGGFVGAGGTTHKAVDIDIGMVVCSTRPPPPTAASSLQASSSSSISRSSVTFKNDKDITDEERLFGGTITDATVAMLGQVMKKGPTSALEEEWLVGLADGSKATFRRSELRLATKKEAELFRTWLSDPMTLPTEALRQKRQRDDNSTVVSILGGAHSASLMPQARKWLQKRLHVRYVGDAKQHLVGKKFVVSSVSYKDDRVLIEEFPVGRDTGGSSGGIETVSTKDLETVLPKVGGTGLVLAGAHRGQMATLVRRVKNETNDGEVRAAVVRVAGPTTATEGTSDVIELELLPDDFCAL
jgi:hypothetical protein